VLRLLVLVLFALPALAAQPYHLELEAAPAAAFPYLGRFGTVELHVYARGVRAETFWLNGFSRKGEAAVTVMNPLARMYVEVPLRDIAPMLTRLAGTAGALERSLAPVMEAPVRGSVGRIAATRHRLTYGPAGWIDVWTTDAIPENEQLRVIVDELVRGISPGTANVSRTLRGTPVYVELNFRRFRNVQLLKLKKLTFGEDEEGLTLPPFYVRHALLELLF